MEPQIPGMIPQEIAVAAEFASVNAPSGEDGLRPLHRAVRMMPFADAGVTIKLLLKAGADVLLTDGSGKTPLHLVY